MSSDTLGRASDVGLLITSHDMDRSGTKKMLAAGVSLAALLLVAGCDDDDSDSNSGGEETSSTEEALPTGPVPEEAKEPDLTSAQVVRVDDTAWIFTEVVSTSENLAVSWEYDGFLGGSYAGDPRDAYLVYQWNQPMLVQPGQVLPMVHQVPVSETDLRPGERAVLYLELDEGTASNEAWAHPWSAEPIAAENTAIDKDGNPDWYHVPWRVSFNLDEPTSGIVLCYDQNHDILGGSQGPVEVDPADPFVDVVLTAGNQSPATDNEPGHHPSYTPRECTLYPTGDDG